MEVKRAESQAAILLSLLPPVRPSHAALPALVCFLSCSVLSVPLSASLFCPSVPPSLRPGSCSLCNLRPVGPRPPPPFTTCRTPTRSFAAVAEHARKELRVDFHDEVEKHFWAIINTRRRHGNSGGEALPRQKRANGGVTATAGRTTGSPPRRVLNTLTLSCVSSLRLQTRA